jgi:hypothetical protein
LADTKLAMVPVLIFANEQDVRPRAIWGRSSALLQSIK